MNKKQKKILYGVVSINLINGTLLSLTPVILKQNPNISLWIIGIYLTLNSIIMHLGSSSYYINKIVCKVPFNLFTCLYIITPLTLMTILIFKFNYLLLFTYFLVFVIFQIIRNISLSNVVMLDENNIILEKKKDQYATISSIFGLLIGQFILDININLFLIYLYIISFISILYSFLNKEKISQKNSKHTKIKVKEYSNLGVILGIDKGISLIITTVFNYFIIISFKDYGYYVVIQSLVTIIFINFISSFILKNKSNINKIINFRSLILFLPILAIIPLYRFNIKNIIIIITSLIISALSSSEGVLLNIIFNKIDHKNINKHAILFSSYYKMCTVFLILSIFIIRIINFNKFSFICLFIIITLLILIINNYYIKNKIANLYKKRD